MSHHQPSLVEGHSVNVIAAVQHVQRSGPAGNLLRGGARKMAIFIGIDGIPAGWVAVYLSDDGNHRFARAKRAVELLSASYDRAMIDMPIGLPERGYRICILARATQYSPKSTAQNCLPLSAIANPVSVGPANFCCSTTVLRL